MLSHGLWSHSMISDLLNGERDRSVTGPFKYNYPHFADSPKSEMSAPFSRLFIPLVSTEKRTFSDSLRNYEVI
jgi:hypothetical protein